MLQKDGACVVLCHVILVHTWSSDVCMQAIRDACGRLYADQVRTVYAGAGKASLLSRLCFDQFSDGSSFSTSSNVAFHTMSFETFVPHLLRSADTQPKQEPVANDLIEESEHNYKNNERVMKKIQLEGASGHYLPVRQQGDKDRDTQQVTDSLSDRVR